MGTFYRRRRSCDVGIGGVRRRPFTNQRRTTGPAEGTDLRVPARHRVLFRVRYLDQHCTDSGEMVWS